MSCHDDEVRIAELTYRMDTDGLTGIASKDKFDDLAQKYYPYVKHVSVIFWDIDNLKILMMSMDMMPETRLYRYWRPSCSERQPKELKPSGTGAMNLS